MSYNGRTIGPTKTDASSAGVWCYMQGRGYTGRVPGSRSENKAGVEIQVYWARYCEVLLGRDAGWWSLLWVAEWYLSVLSRTAARRGGPSRHRNYSCSSRERWCTGGPMCIDSEQRYLAGLFEDYKAKTGGKGTQGRGAYE